MLIYKKFLECDLESSLIDGRNFTIINMFFKILELLIDKNVSNEDVLKAIVIIEKMIEEEKLKYLNISLKNLNISTSYSQREINSLVEYFKKFIEAYSLLIEIINEKKKINDILVEFNNALSHILAVLANKQKSSNLQKAKSHLHRGVLDCYKEIIQLNAKKIKNNKILYSEYLDIRKYEYSHIGNSKNTTEIINKYFDIINKL